MLPGITGILAVIVIFQLLFVCILLVTYPRGKRLSNILFAGFFLAVCLNFTDGVLVLGKAYLNYPGFAFIGNTFSLLFGPLLYLYTRSVVYRDFMLTWPMVLHALPFLIVLGFSIYSYHLQPIELKLFILQSAGNLEYPGVLYVVGALIYLQFFTYGVFSLLQVRKYRATIRDNFSATSRINLNWLSWTIILFMIVIGIGLLNTLSTISSLEQYYQTTLVIITLAIFVFINRILFRAMRQPEIFEGIDGHETDLPSNETTVDVPESLEVLTVATTRKYADSTLTQAEKESIRMHILAYMDTGKPYLEPELTLDQFAAHLSLKPRVVSQVINECIGQNFFDFINRYRIREAERLLNNPADKKITVLEVLYEVGFNSKSSFNTLFKKYTGTTPSAFRKQHMQN